MHHTRYLLDKMRVTGMKWAPVVYLLLVLSLLMPALARGEAGWTSYGQIAELTSTNQFRLLVTMDVSANPSGCRNKSIFYQDQRSAGSEQTFKILLQAVASGNMVRLYVTGNCELNGYSEISSVSIVPAQLQ